MNALETGDLTFTYEDGTVAIKDLTLAVAPGEKLAIVGPNGAGKSTLLHLLAGFRLPFEGEVLIGGEHLDGHSADRLRRRVGLLFQDPDDQLFMPTVEEDVAFGVQNLGLDDAEGRVRRAMRAAGVEHLAARRPHRLSHGEKKRVAIAGILAMEPEILLLDEPTSGLDPRSRTQLIELLRSMDRTMIIATHDLEAAAEIVDRAIVLVVAPLAEGTMQELCEKLDLLKQTGLEPPSLTRLVKRLKGMGYPVESTPVTLDQAVAEVTRVIDRELERRDARAPRKKKR